MPDFTIHTHYLSGDATTNLLVVAIIVCIVAAAILFLAGVSMDSGVLMLLAILPVAGIVFSAMAMGATINDQKSAMIKDIESHGLSQIDYNGANSHEFVAKTDNGLVKCTISDLNHDNEYLVKCIR